MGKSDVLTEYNHLIHLSTNAEFKVCACHEQRETIKYTVEDRGALQE